MQGPQIIKSLKKYRVVVVFFVYILSYLVYQYSRDTKDQIIAAASSSELYRESERNKLVYERHCSTCHNLNIGPNLSGVIGRKAGSYPGFNYSDGMKQSGITWDVDTIKSFLKSPKTFIPGTKMALGPIGKEEVNQILEHISKFK